MDALISRRPELEISAQTWRALERSEFANIEVPLLRAPVEFEGKLYWGRAPLMMVGPTLAAFPRFDIAAAFMPYDEIFRVIKSADGSTLAQIYSVFFEKRSGDWQMIYRLMNVGRALARRSGEWRRDIPISDWLLSATEMTEWLTAGEFVDFVVPALGGDPDIAARELRARVIEMEGSDSSWLSSMMRAGDDGRAVIVGRKGGRRAMIVDSRTGVGLSRLAIEDPTHLLEAFWRHAGKLFTTAADRSEMEAIASDAWHFAHALSSAREQIGESAHETTVAAICA